MAKGYRSQSLSLRANRGSGAEGAYVPSNVELTRRRRRDGLAVRPMMKQGGRTAKLACRWRSG